jgi:TusA-related sulfurtransferase
MTFFDISRKMLKAGFYKYRLYFLCNLSATALFCCFAVISTNRTFMNASIGGAVESVLGAPIEKEDIPKLIGFLKRQEANGKFFSKAMQKEVNTDMEEV